MTHPNDTIPAGFCQCGCGEPTQIWERNRLDQGYLRGQPMRFINGHQGAKMPPYIIDPESGCWIWQRSVSGPPGNQYGTLKRTGRKWKAHRWYWEMANGPVPKGLELHHLCGVRLCVNPDHLWPVTHRENILLCKRTTLSDEDVAQIRSLAGSVPRLDLAERFGVSVTQIGRVINRTRRDH